MINLSIILYIENLFGMEIKLANSNGKYVRQSDCAKTHNDFRKEQVEALNLIHKRIDEIFVILINRK